MLLQKRKLNAFCFFIANFISISISYANINIPLEAEKRRVPELSIVRNIADNITHISRGPRTQLEMGLDDVMKDHSEDHHAGGDTYFRTKNRNHVRELLKLVISDPTRYDIYTFQNRRGGINHRLNVRKTIDSKDVRRIIGHSNLGKDAHNGSYLNHIVLVFSIDNVNSLADSLDHGNFLTAFPAREDFLPPSR